MRFVRWFVSNAAAGTFYGLSIVGAFFILRAFGLNPAAALLPAIFIPFLIAWVGMTADKE